MARVQSRTKKTKPSKNSRVRRRQFIQKKKLSDRRVYMVKEKESKETIEFLRAELEDARQRYQELEETKKQARVFYIKERKELIKKRDEEWQQKIKDRDVKWESCWKRREEVVREEARKEKEKEKQNILQDRAKLFQDKRKVEFERDRLLERVKELEGELGDFKEKYLGFRS
jgi:hypothetical protein